MGMDEDAADLSRDLETGPVSRETGGQDAPVGDKVALVTGAAHGIGLAIAERFVADGWQVICLDRDEEALHAATTAMGRASAHALPVDITDEHAIANAVEVVAVHHKRLDALVCSAGIMRRAPIAALTPETFREVIATNLTSTFLLVRAAEQLLRASNGAVVTIASTRARMSEPDTESYAASKGGLVALSHALAVSLGPDVRVNVVSPGWIDVAGEPLRERDHAQHPAGRVGRPEDVASLVAWLCGEDAGFVTGAEFVVDGGMTRKMIYEE